MKDDLLNVASGLEDIMRDLSYLDPEDMDNDLPGIIDQLEAAIRQLVALADQDPEGGGADGN